MTITTKSSEAEKISDRKPPRPSRACFSFASYAKAVVAQLRASGVPVDQGLSEAEFSAVEALYGFDFPPDLRAILREGLPLGPGFPNWRSSSPQQLRTLLTLPVTGLLHEVSKGAYWHDSWGASSGDGKDSAAATSFIVGRAPMLVPIYRHFYIPTTAPNLAGNPVFYVRGGEVWLAGLDLADFFRREKVQLQTGSWVPGQPAPAWAATSARRVEVWTELAESSTCQKDSLPHGETMVAEGWLDEMRLRLRKGGWPEEEVTEMMAAGMDDGGGRSPDQTVLRNRGSVLWYVQGLAVALLRGGWREEDVGELMGWARSEEDGGDGEDHNGFVTLHMEHIEMENAYEL